MIGWHRSTSVVKVETRCLLFEMVNNATLMSRSVAAAADAAEARATERSLARPLKQTLHVVSLCL